MFATLLIPDFPLAAALRRMEDPPPPPRATADSRGRTSVVGAADEAARRAGVTPGMNTARALGRCPALALVAPDPRAEEAAAGWLLAAGTGISPRVEATAPGVVTIDLRGTDRRTTERRLRKARADCPGIRIGISDTPERSGWAALRAENMVDTTAEEVLFGNFPPAEAPLPEAIRRTLLDWGLPDLLAFARMAKEDVGRRLGPEGIRLWEEMKGRRARLLRTVGERPRFRSAADLEHPVETLEQALFLIRRLLGEICPALAAAGRAARELRLAWRAESGEKGGRRFALPEPTDRAAVLFALLESHLSGVTTEAALVFIGIEAEPTDPVTAQRDLFEVSAENPFRFEETLSRIRGIVGGDRMGVPVRLSSHHPEAWRIQAPPARLETREEAAPYTRRSGPALRRFRPARTIRVWCREGRPVRFLWQQQSFAVRSVRGPWRISGDWWDPRHLWAREEWDVEWDGARFGRLVRHSTGSWEWEGLYD